MRVSNPLFFKDIPIRLIKSSFIVLCLCSVILNAYAETFDSEVFNTLGRNPTKKERIDKAFDLKEKLKEESGLVLVRAASSEDQDYSKETIIKLSVFFDGQAVTYSQAVAEIKKMVEKYGSLERGLDAVQKLNLDDQRVMEILVDLAVEEVFNDLFYSSVEEKNSLENYFLSNNIVRYSDIVKHLIFQMTPAMKERVINDALNKVGRSDLSKNSEFMKKMKDQTFTHKSLVKLFKQIS